MDQFVRIEGSFELLSKDEWDAYLSINLFDNLIIQSSELGVDDNSIFDISHPRLTEMIKDHNNKIGSLRVTYALTRHYYDKGIPDDPWYISPGTNGQSIQYMPLFSEEHWMRRYWFSFFADTFYLKISAVWDSIIEIINHFYGLDYPSDIRLRSTVMKWLKIEVSDIYYLLENILDDPIYKEAQSYRTAAAHGTSPSQVTSCIKHEKDCMVEVYERDGDGTLIMDMNGIPKTKRVKGTSISMTAGEYTLVSTIMKNIEHYSMFTGQKIKELIRIMH